MAKKQIVEDTEETASKSFEESSMEVIKSLPENSIDKFRSRCLVDGGKPLVIGRDGVEDDDEESEEEGEEESEEEGEKVSHFCYKKRLFVNKN